MDIFVLKEEAPVEQESNYVRVTDLSEIKDGSKIVIASRYSANSNEYVALPTSIQNSIPSVSFSSTTASSGEVLPSTITDDIANYEWTVSISGDTYSFVNASGQKLGYKNGSSFGADVNDTWTITKGTASETSLVPNYEGFDILNPSTGNRHVAVTAWTDPINFQVLFDGQMSGDHYNFYMDIFVLKEAAQEPVSGYKRIADISEVKSGSKVVIATRYNENTSDYVALPTTISNSITSIPFVAEGEMLPATITDEIDNYAWTVSIDGDNYSFTNAAGEQLGYNNGSSFGADVNVTWTVTKATSSESTMVPNYEGYNIINTSTGNRYIAINGWNDNIYQVLFTNNLNNVHYNYYVDIFILNKPKESIVATPTFDLEAGSYMVSTKVAISCETSDAVIYYTTDGTEPTETSQVYSEPFDISSTTTVKAIAMKEDLDNSPIAEAVYTIVPISTMADVRDLDAEQSAAVEGVVTYIDGTNVFVQDNTAGISLNFNEGKMPSALAIGDMVRVYGTKNTNNGLVELKDINGTSVSHFVNVSSGNELPLAEVTVEQIFNDFDNDNVLQSTRVKIIGTTIGDVNVGTTTSVTQNGNSINISKLPSLNNVEKGDFVTLTAVIGCNNEPQLHIASSDDIVHSDYIVTDQERMDLACDEESFPIAQGLNIEGIFLNDNINVSTTQYFQISETLDGSYSSSMTIDAFEGNVNKTIYVRLLPFLGSGEYAGVLTLNNGNATCEVELKGRAHGLEMETLDLGYRPVGAKMHSEKMKVKNTGLNPIEIYWADYAGFGFVALAEELEFPIVIEPNDSTYINITTDHEYVEDVEGGDFEATISLFWNRVTRTSTLGKIVGKAYYPTTPDVVEFAEEITSFPFVKTQNVGSLYDNYLLPGDGLDGNDAAYKFIVESDVVLNAMVSNCDNPKLAVYKEDENGEVDAQVDNYYDANIDLIATGDIVPAGDGEIRNLVLTAGTYYMIVSTTSTSFDIDASIEVVPVPVTAQVISPADGEKNVANPVALSWYFGTNTIEYQLLIGTDYPPTEVLVDWTSELNNSYVVESLFTNTNYFWQVNERNSSGVTMGDIWGFTTSLSVAENLQLVDAQIYPGQDVVLTWNAPSVDRYTRGFNVYQDGVKINTELITETTYAVSNLTYNHEGYKFNVTRVHDAGESAFSNTVNAYVTGYGRVEGHVYEQDGITPVNSIIVTLAGIDEFGNEAESSYLTDQNGCFSGDALIGTYTGTAYYPGYQNAKVYDINIIYDYTTSNVDFLLDEIYYPLNDVYAEEAQDESNVSVAWSWGDIVPESPYADFETGDFSQAKFDNTVTPEHVWVITETAYEDGYAMKSSCEAVANGVSSIEITVNVPFDGVVSFYHKVSSEDGADYARFYVDNIEMTSLTGDTEWMKVNVPVTEGKHTYRWTYAKNGSVDNGDDAYFVDNVMMYKPTPAYEGWIYYDNGEYVNSIGTNNVAPVYWGIKFPNTAEYERSTLTKIAFYDAAAANYTANIYIGEVPSTGTLVSSQNFSTLGQESIYEIDLTTPVTLDGKQALWITLYCDQLTHPASACVHTGDSNSDWISLNGTTWKHTTDYNLENSWILRGYLQDLNGKVRSISNEAEDVVFEGGTSSYDMIYAVDSTPKSVGVPSNDAVENNNRAFNSYKVYRHNVITGECTAETVDAIVSELSDTTYVDNDWSSLETGVYRYGVAVVYEGNRNGSCAVNSADPFVPEEGFVLNATETLEYDGEMVIRNVDPVMLRGRTAYANTIYPLGMPSGYSRFELNNPLGAISVAETFIDRGGEYYDGILYGYNSGNFYCKVDAITGELLSYESVSMIMTEMAYNYADKTMYGVNQNTLYTIDIETGAATEIGFMGNTILAFGINYAGDAYGISSPNGNFYSIDLNTAECTFIGATGKGCNYVQCGGFDLNTNKFYWFQCYSVDDMNLYEVNIYNGEATLIAANTGEITSWFIPFEKPSDNQDLGTIYPFQNDNESPIVWSNTVDKDMRTTVDVMFETNTEESAAGTIVRLTNISEPDDNIVYEAILDETGAYTFERFRKGSYVISVENENFSSDLDGTTITILESTTINGILIEITELADLYVSPTGWAMWKRADAKTLIGYTIMLDGNVEAENVLVPYYQHEDVVTGQTYTTTVEAHMTTGTSEPISYTWTAITCEKYDGVTDFTAEYQAGNVTLNWTEPAVESADEWMSYDNGNSVQGIGGIQSFLWGIKLRAEDLYLKAPTTLKKVSMFDRVSTNGMFYIYIGGDNAPEELVHTQEYVCTESYEYVEYELTTSIPIDGTDNVWIIFGTNDGAKYPASACHDTGDADGRWISLDNGNSWNDVKELGLDYSWSINACFNDEGVKALPIGAFLFRNGELITENILTETIYTETVETGAEYEYCVRMVYSEENGDHHIMSCPQCATIEANIECTAPKKLYGFVNVNESGIEGIELIWPYSAPVNEWLYYDNGNCVDGIGGPQSFRWGVMFPVESIANYDETYLTKVSLYDYAASTGDILIYQGGDNAPETLVLSQEYSVTGSKSFVEFELTEMITIDNTQNLWIVFTTNQGTNYPAAGSADAGNANGRWISVDGTTWQDVTEHGLNVTWMIRGFVTNEVGSEKTRALDHYNIYRSNTNNNFVLIDETTEGTYFDVIEEDGTYYYQVTAVYVENGEECESAPATAYDDNTVDYVAVEFVSVNENIYDDIKVYPNPTQGDLNIVAESISRITITNTLGQVIFDKEYDSDNEIIDMAQYDAGVYMIRIITENEVVQKRITFVR